MTKILIIKLRAIGDVVLSTIVLENLRKAFLHAEIHFLTEAASKDVVFGSPLLDKVIVLDRKKTFRLKWLSSLRFLSDIRKTHYDLVFDFFGNPRSALIAWLSGAPKRIGYDYRIRKWAYNIVVRSRADQLHEADWHLDALSVAGIPVVSKKLNFAIGPGDDEFAQKFWQQAGLEGHATIALNFSGGWPAKRWPVERFAELAGRLVEKYRTRIILLWGPGEKPDAENLAAKSSVPVILIPQSNLKQMAAILKKIELLVSTDSGPMHIAAAVGKPCIGIFGPTNHRLQGPYGDIHNVVIKSGLECLGCNRLDCDHVSCMLSLTVDDVMAGVGQCVKKNHLFNK